MKIISSFVNLSQFITIVILLISPSLFGKPVDRSLSFLSISKVQNDTLPPVKTEEFIEPPSPARSIERSKSDNENRVYTFVEQYPEFPGGTVELNKWIDANMNYPIEAREKGIEGKVYVGFIVEKDGTISNPEVRIGVKNGKILDEEALRLVKMMPKWIPGKDKDKVIRFFFTVIIKFKA